jgi:hypothetical protein
MPLLTVSIPIVFHDGCCILPLTAKATAENVQEDVLCPVPQARSRLSRFTMEKSSTLMTPVEGLGGLLGEPIKQPAPPSDEQPIAKRHRYSSATSFSPVLETGMPDGK